MNDELQREIDAYLTSHWDEIVSDIESLVSIESVEDLEHASENAPYGPGPRAALDQALAIAQRMGLEACDCEGRIGYADLKGASDKQVGIIGHVDVVPAGTGWNFPAYAVTRKDGYLIGRGVIDDKGPLMVALHAVRFWKDKGQQLPYTLRVLFGANEETNMKDVEYYREHFDDPAFLFTPDNQFPVGYGEAGICSGTLTSPIFYGGHIVAIEGGQAVNAVPSEASAVVRLSGKMLDEEEAEEAGVSFEEYRGDIAKLTARGVAAHASTPEQGENAIGKLVDYLLENDFCSKAEREFLELLQSILSCTDGSGMGIACEDEHFGALTAVGSVVCFNKVSFDKASISLSLDFRYPTATTAAAIEARMQGLAAKVNAKFAMDHDKQPFLMDPDSPAVQALCIAYNEATDEGRKPITSKGGTYARCFTTGVSFGPEKPWEVAPEWVGTMHGPDEAVSENLLKQAFAIYTRTIGRLMELDL